MTLDGETVYFDEETEDWLLGIGGSSTSREYDVEENYNVEDGNSYIDAEQQTETVEDSSYTEEDEYYNHNSIDFEWNNDFSIDEVVEDYEYEEEERDLDGSVEELPPEIYEQLQ